MTATVLDLWRGTASRLQNGICGDCGENAYVAKQPHARKFQCVGCFERKPTGSAILRRLVRARRRETAAA